MNFFVEWLRLMAFRDLLDFELEVRNDAIDPEFDQAACDRQIVLIQAEINRRIQKG